MLTIFLLLYSIVQISSLKNGLVLTPPMGWLSWERFRCNINCPRDPYNCISENLFMSMADHLANDGYRDAGYKYINIDDCWMSPQRDEDGKLMADPHRFPNGIKFLSQYMHSRGLKLGIYANFGQRTCMGFPGTTSAFMKKDVETFVEWGVDMIKLDSCHSKMDEIEPGYKQMKQLLNETGRPIVFSCSWPFYQMQSGIQPNFSAISATCNLWRNFNDIEDSWSSILSIINFYGDNQEALAPHTGPGHWNDPDMLITGNKGLTYEQAKIQIAVWAILAAPFLMSNDLRNIDPKLRKLLLNKNVIEINQDSLGIQGKRIFKDKELQIWVRPVLPKLNASHSYAILFLNLDPNSSKSVTFTLKQLGYNSPLSYNIIEVFTNRHFGDISVETKISLSLDPYESHLIFAKIVS